MGIFQKDEKATFLIQWLALPPSHPCPPEIQVRTSKNKLLELLTARLLFFFLIQANAASASSNYPAELFLLKSVPFLLLPLLPRFQADMILGLETKSKGKLLILGKTIND